MKNILKISLLMTILTFAFILLGSTNVNAAIGGLQFDIIDPNNPTINPDGSKTYTVLQSDVTSYDVGNIPYGESKTITLLITNTTANGIGSQKYGFFKNSTSTDSSNDANQENHLHFNFGLSGIAASQRNYFDEPAVFQIEIDKAKPGNFSIRNLNVTLIFTMNDKSLIPFSITGTDTSITLSKPVTNPNLPLTYNGNEQTMNFYTLDSGNYTLIDFNDTTYTPMQISGNIGTDAGIYTANIKAPFICAKWPADLPVTGVYNNTYQVQWEIKQFETPVPTDIFEGEVGNTLETIALPTGWSWVDKSTVIQSGEIKYPVKFEHPTDTKNYANVSGEVFVKGLDKFSITFDLSENGNTTATNNPEYLIVGNSKSYTITSDLGYQFTSIKVNGVEQLRSNTVTSMEININNIDRNQTIVATTERIIINPIEEYTNLIYDISKDKLIQIKWDLDFDTFYSNYLKLNGKQLLEGFIFKKGSVILELDSTVLSTLPLGENKIEVELVSGELAVATFTVTDSSNTNTNTDNNSNNNSNTNIDTNNNPGTGDNIIAYIIIGLVAISGIIAIIIIRKKKEEKKILS